MTEQTGIYREDGGKWRVAVLRDEVVDDMREVEMRCLEELRPSPMFGSIEVGEVFDVRVRQGVGSFVCGWDLAIDDHGEDGPPMTEKTIEWTAPGAVSFRLHVETWDGLGPHQHRPATVQDIIAAGFVPASQALSAPASQPAPDAEAAELARWVLCVRVADDEAVRWVKHAVPLAERILDSQDSSPSLEAVGAASAPAHNPSAGDGAGDPDDLALHTRECNERYLSVVGGRYRGSPRAGSGCCKQDPSVPSGGLQRTANPEPGPEDAGNVGSPEQTATAEGREGAEATGVAVTQVKAKLERRVEELARELAEAKADAEKGWAEVTRLGVIVQRSRLIIAGWQNRVPYPLRESLRELTELLDGAPTPQPSKSPAPGADHAAKVQSMSKQTDREALGD